MYIRIRLHKWWSTSQRILNKYLEVFDDYIVEKTIKSEDRPFPGIEDEKIIEEGEFDEDNLDLESNFGRSISDNSVLAIREQVQNHRRENSEQVAAYNNFDSYANNEYEEEKVLSIHCKIPYHNIKFS